VNYFYVVCPVGADPSFSQKRTVLEELASELGLQPFFPLQRRNTFTLTVAKEDIQGAKFVLADLSLERPSCYFELGLAQALGATCFIIAKIGTAVHQIGNESNVAFYSDLEQYRSKVFDILSAGAAL